MNPFIKLPPLPEGSTGGRGFKTQVDARMAALNSGAKTFAVMECRGEYAWISPISAFTARAFPAMTSGIKLIETGQAA